MKRVICFILLFFAAMCNIGHAQSDIGGHWSEKYFSSLNERGIFTGDGKGNYMPEREITRAEFVCAAVRSINEGSGNISLRFTDVDDADFYAPYIYRAAELGIVSGFADGSFRPYASLTREEAVVILSRTYGFLSGYNINGAFSDTDEISNGAKSAFAYAYHKGVISGYTDGTVRPRGRLTRAEAAVMLTLASELDAKEPGFIVGYPRLAEKGVYGCIRLEISTNMPCTVYYTIHSSDILGVPARSGIDKPLVTTVAGSKQVTADIVCDVGNEYNVFLMAVMPDGRYSKIIKIENTAALPFTEGDGSKEFPYGIYNELQLDAIRYAPECEFALKADIELSGEWKPIEDFSGALDGAGYKISGLSVNSDKEYVGFFRRISKGKVINLAIDGRVHGKSGVGIFAGELGNGLISGCVATGYVKAETSGAGGFFGESAGRIENCLSAVYLVEASAFAGGVAGQNYGIISKTVSAVHTVAADMYAGGISSVNIGGRIEKSIAACMNVFDVMMDNCGRITTNKKDGVTVGNYSYDKMKTTSSHDVNDIDNQNGANITWEQLIDVKACVQMLGWEEGVWGGGGRTNRYLLPYPKSSVMPVQIAGISAYTPVRISSAAELLGMIDNPDMNYLLVNDIYFDNNTVWGIAADTDDEELGFSGTLDGGGYTIYNLTLTPSESGRCGLFGMISGGTVRNLRIQGAKITGGEISGAIAAVNNGTIENCTVNMNCTVSNETAYAGGIAGYNYSEISGSEVNGTIVSGSKNIIAGGICAHNEGYVNDTAFKGSITTSKTDTLGESVAGGICGYNAGGMIYNAYSETNLRQQATTIYGGGVCGIQSSGEIYKCSSKGIIISEPPRLVLASAYTGGISGLTAGGLLLHCFSTADINVYTAKSYTGGICGYIETAVVQNVYAANSIVETFDNIFPEEMFSYVGGVCGYNEAGTLGGGVALNPTVKSSGKAGRICAGGAHEAMYSNYSAAEMRIDNEETGAYAGTVLSTARLSDIEFYLKPLAEGGLLGWSDEIWCKAPAPRYLLPVLKDVRHQTAFVSVSIAK